MFHWTARCHCHVPDSSIEYVPLDYDSLSSGGIWPVLTIPGLRWPQLVIHTRPRFGDLASRRLAEQPTVEPQVSGEFSQLPPCYQNGNR